MADFAQRIDNKYGTATYQDTKNTYDWIMKAIQKMNFSVVTGNNNSIGQSNKESLINQWLKAIGQNLISNGVWYILCILGGIVIARLAT